MITSATEVTFNDTSVLVWTLVAWECQLAAGDLLMGFQCVLGVLETLNTNDTTTIDSEGATWNFPHLVYPYGTNSSAKKAGVVYELVARSFYNGNHYIGRFATVTNTPTHRRAIFTYDGMCNDGFSIRELKGGPTKLLGGPNVENLLPGYYTSAVFYVLQGGESAQDWVWNR
ncbi:hypothetical protein PQX77_013879 [Marasmius sp. AFHP31]|nr:hypothetical protein PQX77_013879 [Marasmius sp. AFHP31]